MLTACDYGSSHKHSFKNFISNNDWTCTRDGTKTAKCEKCDETKTVTDTGSAQHTPSNAERENIIPPTYIANGSYDLVVRCAVCDTVISSEHKVVEKLTLYGTEVSSKLLSVEGETLRGKLPNGTESFRFIDDILVADGATYKVYKDINRTDVISTKGTPLEVGDNTFYMLVENDNAEPTTYTVILRVRPIYTVRVDTNGDGNISSLFFEEDSMMHEAHAPLKTGYTITWTANEKNITFPYRITEDVTLTPKYIANEYIATLDVNGGNFLPQTKYSIKFDDDFAFATPTRAGYTFIGWFDGKNYLTSSIWKFTKNKSFVAHWQINSYAVSINKNIANAGEVEIPNETFNVNSNVSVNAKSFLGYNWAGWYSGNTLISKNPNYSFIMPEHDLELTAKWDVREEMENFKFTSTLTECTVTSIINTNINEIIIPQYVTKICESKYFKKITFANDVTEINPYILENCNSLKEVIIPEGVIAIGKRSFLGCSRLSSIILPNSITSIGEEAFKGCSSLSFLTIPDGVTSIDLGAFWGCDNLMSITMSDSIISIASYAFHDCSSLTSITMSDSIISIGRDAFSGCSKLTSISLPDSVTYIGEDAFHGCSSLAYITIPNNITNIRSSTFTNCYSLTSISIPNKVITIESFAFLGCSNIVSIKFSNSITSIGASAFYSCSKITSITFPEGITSIGSRAFAECSSLSSISISDSVTSIGEGAFKGCLSLSSITISDSVTSIGEYAFQGCSSLTSIIIPDSVNSIGQNAFDGSSLTSVRFAESNNWEVYNSSERKPIQELSDPQIAAIYLTKTYVYYTWKQK